MLSRKKAEEIVEIVLDENEVESDLTHGKLVKAIFNKLAAEDETLDLVPDEDEEPDEEVSEDSEEE